MKGRFRLAARARQGVTSKCTLSQLPHSATAVSLDSESFRNGSVQAVENSHELSVQGTAVVSAYQGALTMRWIGFTVALMAVRHHTACMP